MYKSVHSSRHKINRALSDDERSIVTKIKSDPRRVYNYINSKKTVVNGIKALRLDDWSLITDRTEMAEEFNTFFKSVFSTKDEINDIEVAPRTAKSFILDIDKSFSQYELMKRFTSLEPRKAA